MIVITVIFVAFAVGWVCYWLGRGRRLNQAIKHNPEDVLYNEDTGEVVEPGTRAYANALKYGRVKKLRDTSKVTFTES